MELISTIHQRHELARLAALIDWGSFEQQCRPGHAGRAAQGQRHEPDAAVRGAGHNLRLILVAPQAFLILVLLV